MQIDFQSVSIPVTLEPTPLAPVYKKIYQHLQHVDIPFHSWDNPYDTSDKYMQLCKCAQELGVSVDPTPGDQTYFNRLHKEYEVGYNGQHKWLEFHELVHICETTGHNLFRRRAVHIDYREKAGQLQKAFDPAWIGHGVTSVRRGDIFVMEAELGKMPYSYWADGEPDSIDRLHELAKPWLWLKPQLLIAVNDIDLMANADREGFAEWWTPRQSAWCKKWNLPQWTIDNMFSAVVIATIDPRMMDVMEDQLKAGNGPVRVKL